MLEGRTWGPITFVGRCGACIGWRVQTWELLAVVDLEIVGRRGGRIHLWLLSCESLVVAELLVIGGVGASTIVLWWS